MSFASLGISEYLVNSITNIGYLEPTNVQQQVIPLALQGRDVMVAAQTGTGKTASFALPLLELLLQTPTSLTPKQTQVLILTPTRELAAQVHENIISYAQATGIRCLCIFGGVPINAQITTLAGGVDVLVACPGRLLDLIKQNAVNLSLLKALVIDEVDKMLDMGFIPDVRKIISNLPPRRQNLLFSATFTPEVTEIAVNFLHEPHLIEITPPNSVVQSIEQSVYHVLKVDKRSLLVHLLTAEHWQQALIFVRTKHGANRLAEFLRKYGVKAHAIHGDKSQGARTKALDDFKSGEICALVATDIAARGLDIEQLPYVVNFDLPNVAADYVHRIGRTGRAGCVGKAISLVCADEEKLLRAVEHFIDQQLTVIEPPEFVLPQIVQLEVQEVSKTNGTGMHRRNRLRIKPRSNLPSKSAVNSSAVPIALEREEFLDDDVDNFGNKADYVSPYQDPNSKKPRLGKPKIGAKNAKTPKSLKPRKIAKPRLNPSNHNALINGNGNIKDLPKSKRRKRGYRSLMNDDLLQDANVIYNKSHAKSSKTPIILHKSSRALTAEQLATLQQHLEV